MNKLLFFLICIFALSSSFVIAANFNSVSSLTANTKITIPVKFIETTNSPIFKYLKINYSWLPANDFRQQVQSLTTIPKSVISKDISELKIDQPIDFEYKIFFQTKTFANPVKVKEKIVFPLKKIDENLIKFTEPTKLIEITPKIKALASKIVGNDDDLYSVVYKLADWVNTNIEYNLSTVTEDASLPSSWVLEHRKGVCDEMSNLFVSMVRSLGIPAKVVTGIAYTESDLFDKPWGAHGWTEVYFPNYGWIPFDPTYNQLGFVDATHIKLDQGITSKRFNTKYYWLGKGYDVTPGQQNIDVQVTKKGGLLKDNIKLSVEVQAKNVSFNSYNVIKVKIKNLNNFYVTKAISIANMHGVKNLDEITKDVLLKPNETKYVFWTIKLNGNFKTGYTYTFPMLIYTFAGKNVTKRFNAAEGQTKITLSAAKAFASISNTPTHLDSDMFFSCVPEQKYLFVNETLKINCKLNYSAKTNVRVCIENKECVIATAKDYNNLSFTKRFYDPGFKTFVISAEKLPLKEHAFVSVNVLDKTNLEINKLSFKQNVTFDEVLNVNFSLNKKSVSVPKNVSVVLIHKFFEQRFNLAELPRIQPFSVSFPVSRLYHGKNKFFINVTYYDSMGNKYFRNKVFYVDVINLTVFQRASLWANSIFNFIDNLMRNIK